MIVSWFIGVLPDISQGYIKTRWGNLPAVDLVISNFFFLHEPITNRIKGIWGYESIINNRQAKPKMTGSI